MRKDNPLQMHPKVGKLPMSVAGDLKHGW